MKDQIYNKIYLTEAEGESIFQALSNVTYNKNGNPEYIHTLRKIAYKNFPERVLDQFNLLANKEIPYILIENLKIPKPTRIPFQNENTKDDFISENTIIAFSSLLGEPYSIYAEGKEIVNNLIPYKETKNDYTGLGSEVELDFHIENSALNFLHQCENLSPNFLSLLGIAANINNPVRTLFSDARTALLELSLEEIKILRSPSFKIKVPYRWRQFLPPEKSETDAVPMLIGSLTSPKIFSAFYGDMITPITQEAKEVFLKFHHKIKQVSTGVVVKNGDLFCINNKYLLHARESFTAKYDAEERPDRWLQRVFVSKEISSFERIKKIEGRIYEPYYEDE